MSFLKHSFARVFYKKFSKKNSAAGSTLPLICLHGGPGGSHEALLSLQALAKVCPVVLYDQAGGGKSSATKKAKWNLQSFVAELDELTQELGFDEFYLFGASWGTTLALEYYLKHPQKVRGLIFQSPMFSAKDWQKDARKLIAELPTKSKKILAANLRGKNFAEKVFTPALMDYYHRHVLRDRRQLAALMKSGLSPTGVQIYQHMWGPSEFKATGTLKSYDRVAALKRIRVPTLFICGQYDEAQPATVHNYARKVRGADFHVVRGASHVISCEKPKELVQKIELFLRKQR